MNRGSRLTTRLVLVCASLFATGAQSQVQDFSKVEFRSEKLADNLFVLSGAGGNVGVLTGADGALLVDSELVELSPKLRAAVALLAANPPRFVINTHFHFDHAGGNPALGRGGAVILAHDNVRKHLMTRQVVNVGVDIVTEPTPHEGLPVVTFSDGVRLHLDDEEVVVVHAANAHTDSDAFVYFEKADVLHTGDLFMSVGYPFVDGGNGGTLAGVIAAHERALQLCSDKTRVIPGHGPLSDRATLQAYHDTLVVIRQRVADLVKKGRTLEQIKAAQPTREYDARWGQGFVKPDVFLQRVHIEAMRDRKAR